MRVLLWIIGIPVLLLILAVVLIPVFLDKEALVALAAEQLEAQSGIELVVEGDASLSLFPDVALAMSDVRAALPDEGGLIEAKTLATGVALLPLFSGSVEIASVLLEGVTFTTVEADEVVAEAAKLDTSRLSDAELDAFYALRRQARESAAAEAAASTLAVGIALEVGELALREIRAITVDKSGEVISEVLLEELIASDLNIDGRPVPLTAQLTLPDDDAPLNVILNTVFRSDLNAGMVYIDELSTRVTGATPETLELTGSGQVNLQTQAANLTVGVRSAGIEGSGEVRYASFESPQIDATLTLTELTPALLILAGPEAAEAETPEPADDGSIPLPLNALRMIDTRAQLKIDRVVVDAHVLENVDARLRVVDGVATLDPVSAQLHGGNIVFNAKLNGRYNIATLRTAGSITGFDIARATMALDAGVGASGTAQLTWDLSGSGSTSDDLTASLGGPVRFDTKDITIEDIAMERMTCRAVALVNQEALSAEFPVDTRFQALSAEVNISEGVARLEPLTAQLTAVGLTGNGTFDISSGDLRASLRARLSEELKELDPACRINERYTAIDWPVECAGNVSGDPAQWCGIDVTEIVKDLAEGELKRKVTDEAGRLFNKLIRQ
jgi:uncharacterized protein involved in outer membrane biogenesis